MSILKRITPHTDWPAHIQKPCLIFDPDGITIERAMVVYHPHPRTYTGEDVAEISCHGNPLIVDKLLETIKATGLARLADKGEFTKRAYLNGKIDLAQAEAVGALINASSTSGIEMAHSLLTGELSLKLNKLCLDLVAILSEIEASFIIDEIETDCQSITRSVNPLISEIDSLLSGANNASHLYSGVVTTIAGLPNAGKSSLFNAILGYPRAIVHHESGTTRDIIREHLVISGIDFIFHDTAGIRDTSSGPEQIGVQRTIDNLKSSHLVLYVVDANKGLSREDETWMNLGKKTILVMNKADLVEETSGDSVLSDAVWVSAKFGNGLNELISAMTETFPSDLPKVFIERHIYQLSKARDCLINCIREADGRMTPDALAIDLSAAVQYVREILGESTDEGILDRIFSEFCVGK